MKKETKIQEISDILPGSKENRNWKKAVGILNDLTKLQFQLAVFNKSDKKIYKLNCIDYRGDRFDVSDLKMTRYIRQGDGELFNFTIPEELDKYFYPEVSTKTKTEIIQWLSESAGSISVGTQEEPTKTINRFY
ncbi:MAG: hypothetical protein ABIP51_15690 [Bacteroidia bacterium]